mmetsp:Transcript_13561/g.27022  ORF Transcript_13561/g.27022 Transcript_13561/m.27022 type:complete len:346 (+) Transcript_13561:146-1183(+)
MAAVMETSGKINEVHIYGLAVLKIVKHCQESLPTMVTGSLLGLDVGGALEITHAFPFPAPRPRANPDDVVAAAASPADDDGPEGHEYQLEMMKMLREVNVDNNCVGWYQSTYLGSFSTPALVENQYSYQVDLSKNSVVILYDPTRTTAGALAIRAYRLSDAAVAARTSGSNAYVPPGEIFEEIPVVLRNPGLVRALLFDIGQAAGDPAGGLALAPDAEAAVRFDVDLDRLDAPAGPYLEKSLEFMCSWVDDLAGEHQRYQYYARHLSRSSGGKGGKDAQGTPEATAARKAAWESEEAPRRMEGLLVANQIRKYCDQVDGIAGRGFGRLFLAKGLQGENDGGNTEE